MKSNAFTGILYVATCVVNKKCYVGQTYTRRATTAEFQLNRRRRRHLRAVEAGSDFPFHNAIRKYGAESFTWEIVGIGQDEKELNFMEMMEIQTRNSLAGNNGYNANSGGGSRIFCESTKQRMSNSAIQRWANPTQRSLLSSAIKNGREANAEKISESSKRVARHVLHRPDVREKANKSIRETYQSEEIKKARREISKRMWVTISREDRTARLKGLRKYDDQWHASHRAAMNLREYKDKKSKESKERYARPFVVIEKETGEIIGSFVNICDAARKYSAREQNISACLRGKSKSFGFGKLIAQWVEV